MMLKEEGIKELRKRSGAVGGNSDEWDLPTSGKPCDSDDVWYIFYIYNTIWYIYMNFIRIKSFVLIKVNSFCSLYDRMFFYFYVSETSNIQPEWCTENLCY